MATLQQLDHLRKLKALADRPGTEAEGRTARSLFKKKMQQFGATEAQLYAPPVQHQQKRYTTPPDDSRQRKWGHEQPEAIYGDLEARRQQVRTEWQRQHEERWKKQTRSTWAETRRYQPSAPKTTPPPNNSPRQAYDIRPLVTLALILILLFLIMQIL